MTASFLKLKTLRQFIRIINRPDGVVIRRYRSRRSDDTFVMK